MLKEKLFDSYGEGVEDTPRHILFSWSSYDKHVLVEKGGDTVIFVVAKMRFLKCSFSMIL